MRQSVATYLDDFRRHARETAIVRHRGNRRMATSYGELAQLAGRFAQLLVEREVQPGDRVVLWAANGAEWMAAFYGCVLRGVLVVPLDVAGTAAFAARVCGEVQPKLVVGEATLLAQLSGWPQLAVEEMAASLPRSEAAPLATLGHDTPLQLLFTSGTTGDPKGVVHTHGNILASVAPIEQGAKPYLRYERPFHPLRFLHTLPLSHVFGQMMGLWVPPIFAAEVHFEDRVAAPRIMELVHRERISMLAAVPRVLAVLKTHLESTVPNLAVRIEAAKGSSAWMRWWRFRDVHRATGLKFWAFVCGGGALPPAVEQFWNALGYVLVQGYGMTESTALITLNHPFHVKRGSIGKPMAGREVKLNEEGELLVRGPMISRAAWKNGAIERQEDEWLATGDLAEALPTGELRFVGRRSEVIVLASGINVHPEDLEAALEQEPAVLASAVVAMETQSGPEPCAVLALRGAPEEAEALAAEAVRSANQRLAEPQRMRRWTVWPGPDLPRTSTGKVRRKAIAQWLAETTQRAATGVSVGEDWLLRLIGRITGESYAGLDDSARLSEDLHLDSLGRVQLAAALEESVGTESMELDGVETLGELRRELAVPAANALVAGEAAPAASAQPVQTRRSFLYPHWPWAAPVRWVRIAFLEAVVRPLVWLLARPAVFVEPCGSARPLLIVCNHVSSYDVPLMLYALPGSVRRHVAVAMSGEMLEDYRHWRDAEDRSGRGRFFVFGPLVYALLTALFNVFPLPRQRDFQRSFAHAGEALDRGMSVAVFPEGTRSADGRLARLRPGIGLLVRQSNVAVLPVALRGLGEMKLHRRRWFRSGALEVRVGSPIRFAADATEAEITASLQVELQRQLDA